MKKGTVIAMALSGVILLGSGSVYAARQYAIGNSIGEDNAVNFACIDAGVSPDSITMLKSKFDYEKGRFVYDVEFVANGVKYYYDVDSATGEIVNRETEIVDRNVLQAPTDAPAAVPTDVPAAVPTEAQAAAPTDVPASAPVVVPTDVPPAAPTNVPEVPASAMPADPAKDQITIEEAKNAALADAGLNPADVTFTKAMLDRDDGILVYDIEFFTAGAEYDYEIAAATGAVHKRETENRIRPTDSQTAPRNTPAPATSQPVNLITVDDAKNAAVRDAGLDVSAVTFSKAKLERENGMMVYDIEFYTADAEFDYEIDATTGAVRERERENRHAAPVATPAQNVNVNTPAPATQSPSGQSSSRDLAITIDEAKAAAIKRAGVDAGAVTFTKAKLERDDGRLVYDVEFFIGRVEYEYEIDAYTGAVLEEDIESDDD